MTYGRIFSKLLPVYVVFSGVSVKIWLAIETGVEATINKGRYKVPPEDNITKRPPLNSVLHKNKYCQFSSYILDLYISENMYVLTLNY